MSRPQAAASGRPTALGRWIALVLRTGTLLAVAAIAVGFVLGLVGGEATPGAQPVLDLVTRADPDSITAVGLLGLTLIPLGVLGVAAVSFGVSGERRYLLASLVTLGLLVGSLVVAALVARAG